MKHVIIFLAGILVATAAAGAQKPPAASDTHGMMAGQQQMMASMQAEDRKLDDLVAQLKAAQGDDRLDKVIAVVNELVAERKAMRKMMAEGACMMINKEPVAPSTGTDHSTHHPEPGK